MKILAIEDDPEVAAYVAGGLREQGHTVDIANDGREGLFLATEGSYDMIVVDRMLPGIDGLKIVRTIRAAGDRTPVLFLTAISGVSDRVEGLNAGGDDYLLKPFAFSEMLARVNALARRPAASVEANSLQVADLEFDLLRRTVTRGGQKIDLIPIEARLLEYLMRNCGQVATRTMLLEHVWEFHFDPKTNVVETNISRLRTKVDRPFDTELIQTVRGSGYSIRAPA